MEELESAVARHYGMPDLAPTLLQALTAAGLDIERLTPADLAPVDEFHGGGRDATKYAVEKLLLHAGQLVLDVDLPFADAAFDAAVTPHVAMNIKNRARLYGEAARVPKPGALFCIYDVMKGTNDGPAYPVPWAQTPATSHLTTPAQMHALLATAGFEMIETEDRTPFDIAFFRERLAAGAPPRLGTHILMGTTTREKAQRAGGTRGRRPRLRPHDRTAPPGKDLIGSALRRRRRRPGVGRAGERGFERIMGELDKGPAEVSRLIAQIMDDRLARLADRQSLLRADMAPLAQLRAQFVVVDQRAHVVGTLDLPVSLGARAHPQPMRARLRVAGFDRRTVRQEHASRDHGGDPQSSAPRKLPHVGLPVPTDPFPAQCRACRRAESQQFHMGARLARPSPPLHCPRTIDPTGAISGIVGTAGSDPSLQGRMPMATSGRGV
jgi:SAM-dependent methyltransferase